MQVVTHEVLVQAIKSSRTATIQRVEQLEASNRLVTEFLRQLRAHSFVPISVTHAQNTKEASRPISTHFVKG